MKLSTRIFALAFVNLALLAGIFLAFAHYQFHLNLTSFLVAPAEDHVRDVARSVASDLSQTQVSARTNLMARYAAMYGVDFYLFDNDGPQLAGKPVQLPPGVRRELSQRPPAEQPPPPGRAGARPASGSPALRADAPPPRAVPPPPQFDTRPDRPPPPRPDPPPARGVFPNSQPPFGPDGFRPPRPDDGRGGPQPEGRGPGAPDDFGPPPDGRGRGQGREAFLSPEFQTGATPATTGPRRQPRPLPPVSAASGSARVSGNSGNTRPQPSAANAGYQTTQHSEAGLYWAMTRIPVIDPASGDVVHGSLIMAAPSFWGTPLFFDFKPFLGALAAAIGVFVLCWLPFIRGLSRSISRLTDNTGRIAQGDFENHLPENRKDEIGRLSVSINRMAGRLSGFVTGQKRFLGDIAHELSAPIARIQFALGILDQRATPDQREAMEDLQEEIRHMSDLVGELLSFSRAGLDAGSAALVATEIEPLVRQAAAREAPEASSVLVDIPEPVTALAEPNLLLRALSNLLRNAIRYASAGGPIVISARRHADTILIAVADSGPGLPPEELDRVFSPFYRLDASRNRDTGGAGLGLAIVKSCAESCGGTVQCRNRQPNGLEVEILLKSID